MMTNSNHPYHLVDYSPWPLTGAIGVLTLVTGMIKWFHNFNMNLLIIGYIITLLTMYQWWRDISREGTLQGKHTILVHKGLRWGMILFIISEVFFFLSFFWAFFHSSLSPNIEIGAIWPPLSIIPFNPFQIPLLNTIILITSGVTVTWAHHALMENNHSQSTQGLFITVCLGIYFTILQSYEYIEAPFTGLRAVAQTISYEVSLALIFLSSILMVMNFNLLKFSDNQNLIWIFFYMLPLGLCWLSSSMAETNRTPFDFAEGESELVSGFNIEYSSGGFALIFLAEYSSILFMSLLFTIIYLGGYNLTLVFYLKLSFISFLFIWVRGTLPRYRYDKLMYLAWKSYLPISLNFLMFYLGLKIFLSNFF